MPRDNKKGCLSHGRHGLDPVSVQKYRKKEVEQYRNDPVYREKVRNAQGAQYHGITSDEYVNRRNSSCEICGVFKKEPGKRGGGMHVDHDHQTNQLRGTLCDRCNRGLGMFDDDPEKLTSAATYVLRWQKEHLTEKKELA